MKPITTTTLLALTTLTSQALASDCSGDKPWPLTILQGSGLKYFATGTAGGIDETLSNSTQICLPDGSVTVSVGANSGSAGALNTLIECNFVSGDGSMSFCDISMVQGYSVSVTCEVPGLKWLNDGGPDGNKTLGYSENLYEKNDCANFDDKNMLCVNDNGPSVTGSADELADATFFAPAEKGGSLTFQTSKNAYPFMSQGPTGVECTVAHLGRSKVVENEKRDVGAGESLVEERSEAHTHAKRHLIKRATHLRPHPRSLLDAAGK